MVNPCCGVIPLQIGAKIVSIIDSIGAMFGAFTSLVVLLGLLFFKEELEDELYRTEGTDKNYELKRFMEQSDFVQYSMLGFTILVCVLEIIIAVTLFQGARTRNASKCILWFRIHCIVFILAIIFSAITIIISEERIILSVSCILGLLYQAYALWIVRAFINDLNSMKFSNEDEDQGQPLQEIQK